MERITNTSKGTEKMNLDNKDDWVLMKKIVEDSSDSALIGLLQLSITEIAERRVKSLETKSNNQ